MKLIVKGQFVQVTNTATVVLSELDAKFEMFRISGSTGINVNRSRSVHTNEYAHQQENRIHRETRVD